MIDRNSVDAETLQKIESIINCFNPIIEAIQCLEGQNHYSVILQKIQEAIFWIHAGISAKENIKN